MQAEGFGCVGGGGEWEVQESKENERAICTDIGGCGVDS